MKPLRLRIMEALQAVLERITVANGYSADVTVFRDRAFFGSTDPMPLIALLEKADPLKRQSEIARPSNIIGTTEDWPLLVQGFCETPDDAYVLSAEVVQVLMKEIVRDERDILGLKGSARMSPVIRLAVGSPVVRPPDGEGAASAYFWLEVTLTIAENRLDPFS